MQVTKYRWKTYGEDFHNYYAGLMRGCTKTSDGGFVVSGSIGDSIRDVGLLMKFDQDGDSLWSRRYGDTTSTDYSSTIFYVCQQLPDDGYLMAGLFYISSDDWDILLVRTDRSGTPKWSHTYGELHWWEEGYSIVQLPDSNYLIGINKNQPGNSTKSDPGLLKVDNLGNLIWIKYYGGVFDDGQAQVSLSKAGGYLVGSVYAMSQPDPDYPYQKVWVFKTDTSGNMLWERKYSSTEFTGWCSTIDELDDTSIILSGTGSFVDGFGTNGWILKTKQNGDSIWMRRYFYYPGSENQLYDLRVSSDNGMIFTGMTVGDPEWEQSIWVQKLDSIGCDSVRCDTTVGIVQLNPKFIGSEYYTVYPNPASDWIHIVSRSSNLFWHSERYTEIYNIMGEKVGEFRMPMNYGSNDFNVSNLPQGLYLLVIKERQKVVYSGKFLIAR